MPPRLETHQLILGDFIPSDWEGIKRILGDPEVNRYLDFASWTEEKLREWFDQCILSSRHFQPNAFNWTISLKNSDEIIGWFGADKPDEPKMDRERTFTCALDRQYWRHGYMTETLEAIIPYDFTLNGIRRISGMCKTQDTASARMMEKVGMIREEMFNQTDAEGKSIRCYRYAIHRHEYFAIDL